MCGADWALWNESMLCGFVIVPHVTAVCAHALLSMRSALGTSLVLRLIHNKALGLETDPTPGRPEQNFQIRAEI